MKIYQVTYTSESGIRRTVITDMYSAQEFARQVQAAGHQVLEIRAI